MRPNSLQMVTVVRAAGRYVCHSLLTQSCVSFPFLSLSLSPLLLRCGISRPQRTTHRAGACGGGRESSRSPRQRHGRQQLPALLPSPRLCVEAAGHSPFPPSWLTEAAGAQSQTREENTTRSIGREREPLPSFRLINPHAQKSNMQSRRLRRQRRRPSCTPPTPPPPPPIHY